MIVLDLSILNQKGTPMFNSDTFANRPTFGIVGRIFISTDTKEFFRDTGTSWELIGGPGSGTITGSGAATQVAFWNSANTITGSNNLWYDSTNSYLGVNTNAPGNPLDVHGSISSVAALNQTTATNNTLLSLLNSGTPLWRIGNFYTAGANDFGIFDVVNTTQQLTIVKSTGQTFIGAKTTASGRLVVNSATADAHLQIVGANSPSIRIDNAGSGGTQRFVIGNATATNNFIQGSTAGDFCITTASAAPLLFGMWQTTNASEVMRITTSNNLLIGTSVDGGQRLQVNGISKFTDQIILDAASGNYPLINFNINNVNKWQIFTDPINDDLVINQGTNRFYFLQNGNSTFGTNLYSAPRNFKFSVIDNIATQYTTSTQQVVQRLFNITQTASSQNTSCCLSFQVSPDASGSNPIATIGVISETYGTNDGSFVICTRSATGILEKLRVKSTGVLNLSSIPTSSAGLSSGDIWSNLGILNIVP